MNNAITYRKSIFLSGLLLGFVCINFSATAQNDSLQKSALFLELGGSGGFGSLNYEHTFLQKGKTALNWRAGLIWFPGDNKSYFVLPLMMNVLLGKSSPKIEAGIGQGVTVTTTGKAFLRTTLNAGLRFQKEGSRLFFRVNYTPLISYLIDFQYEHWAGISIGYTLKSKQ